MIKEIHSMKSRTSLLLIPVLALSMHIALAASPNFTLQKGGKVTVDPDTNRATVTRGGVTTPMWDGTHRLDDGSVLIIKQGVTVPNRAILDSRQPQPPEPEDWEGAQIAGYSPCEKLTRRVCGTEDQCGKIEGCNLARQLLDMEESERAASEDRNRMTYTSSQCQHVMTNAELFPLCPQTNPE
jgi:hypothetical protein